MCFFYRLTGSPSHHDIHAHQNLLDHIWRNNLDAFWYRKQVTLYNLTHMFSEEVTTGQHLVFQMFPTSPGTFPNYYDGGPQLALGVLTW